jgi:uncharacterized membrane protein
MIAAVMALAAVGLADSVYLFWIHVTANPIVCPVGGCDVVNASPYAKVWGFPVAGIGMVGYLTLLGMAAVAWRAEKEADRRRWLALVCAASGLGVLYAVYLTYLELFVIHAICFWCVASACAVTLICLLSALALRRPAPLQS